MLFSVFQDKIVNMYTHLLFQQSMDLVLEYVTLFYNVSFVIRVVMSKCVYRTICASLVVCNLGNTCTASVALLRFIISFLFPFHLLLSCTSLEDIIFSEHEFSSERCDIPSDCDRVIVERLC